jgi:hypothetical protein
MEKSHIWSVKEFQEHLEKCLQKCRLPRTPVTPWSAKLAYEGYRAAENKMAKLALLNQLAEILAKLRLRNPAVRFSKIIAETGIDAKFARDLVTAYINPDERWG